MIDWSSHAFDCFLMLNVHFIVLQNLRYIHNWHDVWQWPRSFSISAPVSLTIDGSGRFVLLLHISGTVCQLLLLLLQMKRLKWCCRENAAGALYIIITREKLVNVSQNCGQIDDSTINIVVVIIIIIISTPNQNWIWVHFSLKMWQLVDIILPLFLTINRLSNFIHPLNLYKGSHFILP